ncbi:DUF2742 domain-containing protein [Nocardiopsis sp. CNT312]|uniref:DUF2742 domain-containing protein n=1 Tax=Nocardiopsis sp. CNT312 TaxID=1137268 RepID=UPI00048CE1F8|nr:DUF2742 domain-containing protein [Nocardiopsis sp. CNT312]
MPETSRPHVRSYRREWARRLIARGNTTTPPPAYGTPAWCALPEAHPAKIAAVVLAAEAWAWGTDPLPEKDQRPTGSERGGQNR